MTDVSKNAEILGFLIRNTVEKKFEKVKSLIDSFPKNVQARIIDHRNERWFGHTAMHLAAAEGTHQILDYLAEHGGDPNRECFASDLRQTPVHIAAKKDHPRCLQVLLGHSGSLATLDQQRRTARELARGKPQCEEVIKAHYAKTRIPERKEADEQIVTSLHDCCKVDAEKSLHDFKNIFHYQLPLTWQDLGTRFTDLKDKNGSAVTLLYRVCHHGNKRILDHLLSLPSTSDPLANLSDGCNPLHAACTRNDIETASKLLKRWPQLLLQSENKNERNPLHIACHRCSPDMVALFLSVIDDILSNGQYTEDNRLDLNIPDHSGNTPLHFACCNPKCLQVVPKLLKFKPQRANYHPIDVNAKTTDKERTALHIAISRHKCRELLSLLLQEKGVDISPEGFPAKSTVEKFTESIADLSKSPYSGHIVSRSESNSTPSDLATPTPLNMDGGSPDEVVDPGMLDGDEEESKSCTVPKQPMEKKVSRFTAVPSDGVRIDRPRTSTDISNAGDFKINPLLYQFENNFEVLLKGTAPKEAVPFSELSLTPLAEACAIQNAEAVEVLLMNGAKDAIGIAVLILQALKNNLLLQMLLSFHSELIHKDSKSSSSKLQHEKVGLQVKWNKMKIKEVDCSWLSEEADFHPLGECFEDVSSLRTTMEWHNLPNVSSDTITHIDLSKNLLSSDLPIEIFQLPHLEEVNVASNELSRLPISENQPNSIFGWRCYSLKKLTLDNNRFVKLPHHIWFLPRLEHLSAKRNQLVALDRIENVDELSSALAYVDLSENMLEYVSDFPFLLPNLKKLNLAKNQLPSLSPTLWKCLSLEELDMSHNKLRDLPLCELEATMDNSNTQAVNIPKPLKEGRIMVGATGSVSVMQSPGMNPRYGSYRTTWTMSSNYRDGPTAEIVQVDGSCSLRILRLSFNQLTFFPEALPCFTPSLKELYIDHNKFDHIDVSYLSDGLQKLDASHCELSKFGLALPLVTRIALKTRCRYPAKFGQDCIHRKHLALSGLKYLILTHNKIQHFGFLRKKPSKVCQQQQEPAAAVEKDQVQTDSAPGTGSSLLDVSQLVDCEREASSNTGIDDLLFPKLCNLDLSNNNLTGQFSPNVGFHSSLQSLKLSNNPNLTHLPIELGYLKRPGRKMELNSIKLDGNSSLQDPPKEYWNKDISTLIRYFRSRLTDSVYNRTIKLMVVGYEKRGKSTLLKRLRRGANDPDIERTEGIDISDWSFPDLYSKIRKFSLSGEPVTFLTWDFGGQDDYYVTHQCFFSKRSLYLVLFRLDEDKKGINELDSWLRNIHIRAPGCPVIIVGTHMDKIKKGKVESLLSYAEETYSRSSSTYPSLAGVRAISSVNKINNGMEELRHFILKVACHLFVQANGELQYVPDKPENDPKALFKQKIPRTYLNLQHEIRKTVQDYKKENKVPVFTQEEFRETYHKIIEDNEELEEAVKYLHDQGTMLHYSDPSLNSVYFLDPQWLTKMMAQFIGPPKSAMEPGYFTNGVIEIEKLLELRGTEIPKQFQKQCVLLLGRFGVIHQIDEEKILIPSLMSGCVPILPGLKLSKQNTDEPVFTTLRRFWFTNSIPPGFWPRLICRVIADRALRRELQEVIPGYKSVQSPESTSFDTSLSSMSSLSSDLFPWRIWNQGMVWAHQHKVILQIKEIPNEKTIHLTGDMEKELLSGDYRVEVHFHVSECFQISGNEQLDNERKRFFLAAGTKIFLMVKKHIESLVGDWFSGLFLGSKIGKFNVPSFTPCWKCLEMACPLSPEKNLKVHGLKNIISLDNHPVYCFTLEECIGPASRYEEIISCPFHEELELVHVMPDLVFFDLYNESTADYKMEIDKHKPPLGSGSFGFVLEAKWGRTNVGAKFSLMQANEKTQNCKISELLAKIESQNAEQYFDTYDQIRNEVDFFCKLRHPNLVKMVGVNIKPICLMLELAPRGSLRRILKEYDKSSASLQPLTMKKCVEQMAAGLFYLHRNRIAHLDIKSDNILAWQFPSALLSYREQVARAEEVDLRITDYGISKLIEYSGAMTDTIHGTPGYTAPEMVSFYGAQLDFEKGDVFSFGITLSELATLKVPFYKRPHQELNTLVKEGIRPYLTQKDSLSAPIILQKLMTWCWDSLPQNRPSMAEICEISKRPEFHRLRNQINVRGLNSITASCVFRMEPSPMLSYSASQSVEASLDMEVTKTNLPTRLQPHGDTLKFSSKRSTLKSYSSTQQLEVRKDKVELSTSSECSSGLTKSMAVVRTEDGDPTWQLDDSIYTQPHTQMWICGRNHTFATGDTTDEKGLTIFSIPDGEHNFTVYSSPTPGAAEITAMCQYGRLMWMGTSTGELQVLNINNLMVRFSCYLDPKEVSQSGTTTKLRNTSSHEDLSSSGRRRQNRILSIISVPEENHVIVTTNNSQIWCIWSNLCDLNGSNHIEIEQIIELKDQPPIYQMCKVVQPDGRVEIWGTSEGKIAVISYKNEDCKLIVEYLECIFPNGLRLPCQCITNAHFLTTDGHIKDHVWVSTTRRNKIICWDAQDRKQLHIVEVKMLDPESSVIAVHSILASGHDLFVGTTTGMIGVFNAESGDFIHKFHYHSGKVREILEVPLATMASLCTEIPSDFLKEEEVYFESLQTASLRTTLNNLSDKKVGTQPMILSIGNGSLPLKREQLNSSPYSPRSPKGFIQQEEICLQCWTR